MRKLFLLLLLPVFLFAQNKDTKALEDQISLNVLGNISTFRLNGDFKVFEGPFSVGVQYTSPKNRVDAGIYLAPVVDEGKESNSSLSVMPFINIYKQFGFGFGYSFWQAGKGIVKPENGNLFLSFNFSLLQ